MYVGHLCVFFRRTSIQMLCTFFNQVICFFAVVVAELYEFFIYFGYYWIYDFQVSSSLPQWDITSHPLEWLLLKGQEITNVGEKGTFIYCWGWGCKLVQPLWKTVWRFVKKLRIELPYDPAILLLGIHPMHMKTLIRKDICTPMFITELLTIAKV